MRTSESIKQISVALLEAQKNIESAVKDSKNPFFRNSYADVNSVIDACKEQLNKVGVSVYQPPHSDGTNNYITTRLQHSSGEYMESDMLLLPVKNMQELGSAITYARRYSLQSWMLMGAVDDDGNLASNKTTTPSIILTPLKPKVVESKFNQEQKNTGFKAAIQSKPKEDEEF